MAEPTRLSHLDLYRLDDATQIIGAGLEDTLLRPEGVCLVEWIERWWPWAATLNPPPDLRLQCPVRLVRIETLSETARLLRYVDLGL
jgi:tRNA A37 threonylcarbamoyladenosine biosynthesis protein TsaE